MGCRCDYMEPDKREKESQLVAKLLIYLADERIYLPEKFDEPHDAMFVDAANSMYGNPRLLDLWTNDLCSLIQNMTEEQQNKYLYDGRNPNARALLVWWENHQVEDAARKILEEEQERKEQLVSSALQKLTADELEALLDHERFG
jgi:hypothetical protein